MKDRCCSNPECPLSTVYVRPLEERAQCLPRSEFGLDVLAFIGEQHMQQHNSFRWIRKALVNRHGVLICERHVPNLFRLYLALLGCRNLTTEAVQKRLREQGRAILSCDAVKLDQVSPALYVVREVLSDEILYAARIEHADKENLVRFLKALKERWMKELPDVPIEGIVSDKEKALVAAFDEVFPGVPHQLCHTHFFKNLVKPMESDLTTLNGAVQEVVGKVADLEKKLDKQKDADPEERELTRMICKGARAVGKSQGGDKLFEPPALRRFQRLKDIWEMVGQALERKKGSDRPPPLLTALMAILALLAPWQELARRLERQVEVVREIARLLGGEGTGKEIAAKLRSYLDTLLAEAPRRGRGAARGRFCRHVAAVSERFWRGLFHCYDHPDLPRTNNELEQFFAALRYHYRRTYGRKSTAGGPLESFAPYLLELWPRFHEELPLTQVIEGISAEELQKARQKLAELSEPARQRRAFLRKPKKILHEALTAWLDS